MKTSLKEVSIEVVIPSWQARFKAIKEILKGGLILELNEGHLKVLKKL